MKTITTLLFFILTSSLLGQQTQYVKADNGLIVRESPDRNSKPIGKLEYGTGLRVIQETDIQLEVKDGQETIVGNWVEIEDIYDYQIGYVFNGYLTSNKLSRKIQIRFDEFTLEMELDVWDEDEKLKEVQKDNVKIYPDIGESPQGKKVKVKQSKFKKIEIFQRHENSVTIMNEGPHCDLTDWKHYYSKWKKLNYNAKENTFISDSYEPEDREKFISVDINELKKEVEKGCGTDWSELVKSIKDVNEYPSAVALSRIYFKIILTDDNGSIIEKTISFEIPIGC